MSSNGKAIFIRKYNLAVAPKGSSGTLGAIEATLGIEVEELRIQFKVKKTLKPEPNTAEMKVYNLAGSSRRVLEAANKLSVRLEAGYESLGTSQLYLGEVRNAWTEWVQPDCITTMTTGDSEKEIQESRIHVSVGAGVPVETAMSSFVRALGIGEGNAAQAVAMLRAKGVASGMFGPGTAISGNAWQELRDYCRSAGLEVSIQDGLLQVLDKNKPLQGLAVELSEDSGLVGSPSIDFQASSKSKVGGTYVKAKALLIPELVPGRKVTFKSKSVSGGYRIEEVEYVGDSHGTDWYAMLTCRSYT